MQRRQTANLYSMSSLVMYEPFVDRVNGEFMATMANLARSGQAFDLFTWMQFYAFDVIGEITIGEAISTFYSEDVDENFNTNLLVPINTSCTNLT
jgi:hypothetical protein